MYRYKFTVELCGEVTNYNCNIECGYAFGGTLMEAGQKIADYYGEDDIVKLYLEPDCGDQIIILQEDMEKFDTDWVGPAQNEGF